MRKRPIVDALAGRRVLVEQRHDHHARAEIVADEAADQPRARDVAAQLLGRLRRAVVVVGHHRSAAKSFFGDFGPAHARRPQRLHPRAVDAGGQEELVMDLPERREVLRVVDVSFGVLHHDAQRVAEPAQLDAVVQVVLDIRVAARDHLLEAGVERQLRHREHAEQQRDHRAADQHGAPVVEHQPLEQRAGAGVEFFERARLGLARLRVYVHVGSFGPQGSGNGWAPRGPAMSSAPLAAPITAAAGMGRSTDAGAKVAPSSRLVSRCPA